MKLGEAYVDIVGRDARFNAALGRNRDQLGRFVSSANRMANIGIGAQSVRFDAAVGRSRNLLGQFVAGAGKASNIPLGANAGPFLGILGRARSMVGGLVSQMGGINFGGTAAIAGVAGLGLGIKKAADSAIDMESALVKLAKATDLDPAGMEKLKGELFGLSTELKGVKLDDLIAMATTGAKLGIGAGQLGEYARGMAMVSTAMDDIPADRIADEIGKINIVFGLGVPGTMKLGSAIDKVADSGASSAADILDVTQRISGAAKAAGITADEAIAMAGALLDTGTHAELAAGSFNRLFQVMQTTKGQAGFAAVLGIDAKEAAAKIKAGPTATIQEFMVKLKSMDAMSQNKALKAIGVDAIRGGAELQKFAQVQGNVATYMGYTSDQFREQTQLTMSYNRQSETTGATLDQVGNKFQILAVSAGTALLPTLNKVADAMGSFATSATKASQGGAVEGFGGSLVAGFQAIGATVAQFPAHLSAAIGPEALGSIGAGFGEFVTNLGIMWRNLPAIIDVTAIMFQEKMTNMGETLAWLGESVSAFLDWFGPNWVSIFRDAFVNSGTMLTNLGTNLFDFLQEAQRTAFGKEWNFKATSIFEGADLTTPALKLPELKLSDFGSQIDEKLAAINAKEAGLGKGAASLTAPGATPGKTFAEQMAEIEKTIPVGPGTDTFAGIEKAKKGKDAAGQILTADAFTAAATKASVGAGGGVAEKQLKVAEEAKVENAAKLDAIKTAIEKNKGLTASYA